MTNNQAAKEAAEQGEKALREGKYREAEQKFTQAIDLTGGEENSKYAWAFAHRGAARGEQREYNDAKNDLNKAIHLTGGEENSKYAWAFAHRGWAYIIEKDYEKAKIDLTKAIDLTGGEENSKYIWAFAHRGVAHYDNKEYDLAEKDLTKAINSFQEKGTYAWACAYRAMVYIQQGYSAESKKSYEEAMKRYRTAFLDIYNAIIYDVRVYTRSPELCRVSPENCSVEPNQSKLPDLGKLLAMFGEVDRGIEAYGIYLENNPNDLEVKQEYDNLIKSR